MSMAYRGLDYAAERSFEALGADAALTRVARGAYARRVARSAAGLVALALGLVMFADALRLCLSGGANDDSGALAHLLLTAWLAALPVYVLARIVAGARFDARVRPVLRTGDAAFDLASLETNSPKRVIERLAAQSERWSVALPMMALSMITPLTLHYLIARLVGWASSDAEYGRWIMASTVVVGHAHVALAVSSWLYARRVGRLSSEALVARGKRDWLIALGVACFFGAVPGILLFVIPPALVLLTGLAFIPLMYVLMRRALLDERMAFGCS